MGVGGVMGTGLIATVASRYFSDKGKDWRGQLLLGAAGYLREYSGENPDEALQDVLGILEVAGRAGNKNVGLRAALTECLRVKANVGESLLYSSFHPALISLAERIETLV